MSDAPALPASSQSTYQVRFARGTDGLARVGAHADLVIWVDALPDLAPNGGLSPRTAPTRPGPAADASPGAILLADLTTRSDAAEWMLAAQVAAKRRVSVAVVAASDAAEDTLAAGAVVDALAARGIDFSSPEAAVVCASFAGLERAVAHLLTASVAGRRLVAAGHGETVSAAAGIDSASGVVV